MLKKETILEICTLVYLIDHDGPCMVVDDFGDDVDILLPDNTSLTVKKNQLSLDPWVIEEDVPDAPYGWYLVTTGKPYGDWPIVVRYSKDGWEATHEWLAFEDITAILAKLDLDEEGSVVEVVMEEETPDETGIELARA